MSAEAERPIPDGRASVHAWIAEVAKPLGFRKRRTSWYLHRPETVLLINVQKSRWYGETYYINLAIWVKALGESKEPVEYRCHVRQRLMALGEHDCLQSLDGLLDFERATPALEDRRSTIVEALTKHGLPFLLRHASLEELRTAWAEDGLGAMIVTTQLRNLFSSLHS